jgi:hypothetical protein
MTKDEIEAQREAEEERKAIQESDGIMATAAKPKPAGKSRVNGELVDDPPDIARLRATGAIPVDAIPEVTEGETGGATLDDIREEYEERRAIQEDAPSDEEWLAALPLSSMLEGKPLRTFRGEALAYRELESHRRNFGSMVSRIRNRHFRYGTGGPYFYRLRWALTVKHPKQWVRCAALEHGGCAGTGQVKSIGSCPKCHGHGFRLG